MNNQTTRTCILTVLLSCASPAFAWGEQGHTIVNVAAANLMESQAAAFFQANTKALGKLATTPDIEWKKSQTYDAEAPMHFFQWDNYSTSSLGQTLDQVVYSQLVSKLGADYVKTNGSSVWRVDQIYVLLVNAMKAHDWTKVLQMAGTLGHYVGDLSQPMHDTADYDGQSIGRRGIHMYFETTLVKTLNQGQLQDTVTNAGGPLRQQLDQSLADTTESGDQLIRTMVVQEGTEAYGQLQPLLADFDPSGQQDDNALEGFFGPRMGAGAANLSKIWDLAVHDAGVTEFPTTTMTVAQPDWFPLQDPGA
jgi:hypothetical protein